MLKKIKSFIIDGKIRLGLGTRLVAGFLIIAIIPMALAAFTAIQGINEGIEGQAQSAINSDLNSANEILNQRLKEISLLINFLSSDDNMEHLINTNDRDRLRQMLMKSTEQLHLCFLTLIDREGNVIIRVNNESSGDNLSDNQIISEVMSGRTMEGIVILDEGFLESEGLAERAYLNIGKEGNRYTVGGSYL